MVSDMIKTNTETHLWPRIPAENHCKSIHKTHALNEHEFAQRSV